MILGRPLGQVGSEATKEECTQERQYNEQIMLLFFNHILALSEAV